MKTVIVTGGIGSGKSTVCAFLRERGIPVYDSDGETKSLYDRSPQLTDTLERLFGCPLRTAGGRVDRRLLASMIFSDPLRRSQLEEVVYPAVREDFLSWREAHADAPFVVLESAVILSKPQFAGLADFVVLVDADPELRLSHAVVRDGSDPENVRGRMSAQAEVYPGVDAVIRNDGSLEELREQTDLVFGPLFCK